MQFSTFICWRFLCQHGLIHSQCNVCVSWWALLPGEAGEPWPVKGLAQTVVCWLLKTLIIISHFGSFLHPIFPRCRFPGFQSIFLNIWKRTDALRKYCPFDDTAKMTKSFVESFPQQNQATVYGFLNKHGNIPTDAKTMEIQFYFCF